MLYPENQFTNGRPAAAEARSGSTILLPLERIRARLKPQDSPAACDDSAKLLVPARSFLDEVSEYGRRIRGKQQSPELQSDRAVHPRHELREPGRPGLDHAGGPEPELFGWDQCRGQKAGRRSLRRRN